MITPINFSCLKEDFKCLWGVNDMGTKEEENKGVQNQNLTKKKCHPPQRKYNQSLPSQSIFKSTLIIILPLKLTYTFFSKKK